MNKPLVTTSGYRSEKLNRAVGGARDSNHLTGCAADIVCRDCEQAVRYAAIVLDLSLSSGQGFDELIIERKFTHYWLHFDVRKDGNRCKVSMI